MTDLLHACYTLLENHNTELSYWFLFYSPNTCHSQLHTNFHIPLLNMGLLFEPPNPPWVGRKPPWAGPPWVGLLEELQLCECCILLIWLTLVQMCLPISLYYLWFGCQQQCSITFSSTVIWHITICCLSSIPRYSLTPGHYLVSSWKWIGIINVANHASPWIVSCAIVDPRVAKQGHCDDHSLLLLVGRRSLFSVLAGGRLSGVLVFDPSLWFEY